ncbi:hypothetical protein ABZV31_30345 [Streptomyces sp. NPDC005202]|uniref:hypothetical protein n=1 Tax=Streptomyces sp. NPDC005202 TaxID=3157021 RepID=UPI0033B994E8
MRKSVNVLLCLTAVVGIGWSGRVLWQVWDARRQIDEACAGLVPAGRVLALSPAGGTISHRVADEGTIELDAGLPQDCEIFSTEAGEKYGTGSSERWFFTGAVGVLPGDRPVTPEDPMDDLVDPFGNPTFPDEPLGGGLAGVVTDSGVTVELPCAEGRVNGDPVKALWARASLQDPGPPFTEHGQLSAHDRNTLAETAVLTANNLARHRGTPVRRGQGERRPGQGAVGKGLAAGSRTPLHRARAAQRARPEHARRDRRAHRQQPRRAAGLRRPSARPAGRHPRPDTGPDTGRPRGRHTCAWYRKAGFARQEQLADQVLEGRPDDKLWDERRALVLSNARANSIWWSHADRHTSVTSPSRPSQWYVSLHTYSGEDAKNVRLKRASTNPRSPRNRAGRPAATTTRCGGPPPSATGRPRSTP